MALIGAILSKHWGDASSSEKETPKKFKRIWKKVLTNEERCANINKLSPRGAAENVPWKLNNVRKQAYAK